MFLLITLICWQQIWVGNDFQLESVTLTPDGVLFQRKGLPTNSVAFVYVFDLISTDSVYYYTGTDSWPPSDLSAPGWNQVQNPINKLFGFQNNIFVLVKSISDRQTKARLGESKPNDCPDGTYVLSDNSFNLNNFLTTKQITPPKDICVVMFSQGTETITNTLPEGDRLFVNMGNNFQEIARGQTQAVNNPNNPTYLKMHLQSNSPYNFEVSVEGITNNVDASFSITDKQVINGDYDNSSPAQPATQQPTPSSPTPSSSSTSSSSSSSSSSTSSSSSSSLSSSSSSKSSIATPNPDITPFQTPDATWEGDWDDPPNVIIRGDDIPEIHETHPPLQTNYIKTAVPYVTKTINVSAGTIIIVCIVTLTIVNLVRSYRRLKVTHEEPFEDNSDFEEIDSSFKISTESEYDAE